MVNQNHELLIELWSRVKSHIAPKERLETADIFLMVFDEFGLVDDELLDEDLDKELRAAARSHLEEFTEESDEEIDDESSW